MKKILVFCILMVVVTACGTYKETTMKPWIGATQDELVSKWGYPQSANDVVKIDDVTTVFTYRSFRSGGMGGQKPCVVSFTLKNKSVTDWKYEGQNCPRNNR